MKKFLFLAVILFKINGAIAQLPEQQIRWVRMIAGGDLPYKIMKVDESGNVYILCQHSGSFGLDNALMTVTPESASTFLVKFDSTGQLKYYKHFPNSYYPTGLALDGLDNIYISYHSYHGYSEHILKLNSSWNIQWHDSVIYSDPSPNTNHLCVNNNGDLYMCSGVPINVYGVYFNNDSLYTDTTGWGAFILKINSSTGNLSDYRRFTSVNGIWTVCVVGGMSFNKTNDQLVVYLFNYFDNLLIWPNDTLEQSSFMLSFDSNMNLLDRYLIPQSNMLFDHASINFDAANNIYMSFGDGTDELVIENDTIPITSQVGGIIKLNESLEHNWHRYYSNNESNTFVSSSSVNSSGSVFFTLRDADTLVGKLNTAGDYRWNFSMSGEPMTVQSITCGVHPQLFGMGAISGPTEINGITYTPDSSAVLLYRLDDPDSLVSVNEIESPDFTISPNPSHEGFTISSLSNKFKKMEVINSLGEIVFSKEVTPEMFIRTDHWLQGIYLIKIYGDGSSSTRKLVVE